jgi:hypothetical protein
VDAKHLQYKVDMNVFNDKLKLHKLSPLNNTVKKNHTNPVDESNISSTAEFMINTLPTENTLLSK